MRKSEELTNPGSCMSRAHPDEMTFVLLGRDIVAPKVIREWCRLRCLYGKNTVKDRQIVDALECADAMERENGKGPMDLSGRIDGLEYPEVDDASWNMAIPRSVGLKSTPTVDEKIEALTLMCQTLANGHDGTNAAMREFDSKLQRARDTLGLGNFDTSVGQGCDECGNTHGDAHSANCMRGKK